MSVTVGDSTITVQNSELMSCFRRVAEEIPHSIGIFQIRSWVTLLRVNEIWKFQRIPNEKNGCIVTDHIVISCLKELKNECVFQREFRSRRRKGFANENRKFNDHFD
jgi:hypothetical protein